MFEVAASSRTPIEMSMPDGGNFGSGGRRDEREARIISGRDALQMHRGMSADAG